MARDLLFYFWDSCKLEYFKKEAVMRKVFRIIALLGAVVALAFPVSPVLAEDVSAGFDLWETDTGTTEDDFTDPAC